MSQGRSGFARRILGQSPSLRPLLPAGLELAEVMEVTARSCSYLHVLCSKTVELFEPAADHPGRKSVSLEASARCSAYHVRMVHPGLFTQWSISGTRRLYSGRANRCS